MAHESCQGESSQCGPEDAGVQLAPVPVFLLACVGNLEDAREVLVWSKLQVCIWNLTLCSFLPMYNAWLDVSEPTVGSKCRCKAGTCSCSS